MCTTDWEVSVCAPYKIRLLLNSPNSVSITLCKCQHSMVATIPHACWKTGIFAKYFGNSRGLWKPVKKIEIQDSRYLPSIPIFRLFGCQEQTFFQWAPRNIPRYAKDSLQKILTSTKSEHLFWPLGMWTHFPLVPMPSCCRKTKPKQTNNTTALNEKSSTHFLLYCREERCTCRNRVWVGVNHLGGTSRSRHKKAKQWKQEIKRLLIREILMRPLLSCPGIFPIQMMAVDYGQLRDHSHSVK